MTFDTATGAISGTPTTATAQNVYTITASNAAGSTTFVLTLIVYGPLLIASGSPPNGRVGARYAPQPTYPGTTHCNVVCGPPPTFGFIFRAVGGTPPYAWTATSLPPGLPLAPSGLFSGTPTSGGTFNFIVTVTDSASPAVQMNANYTIVIAPPPPPAVRVTRTPVGAINLPYGFTFSTSSLLGAPFAWRTVLVTGGEGPAGFSRCLMPRSAIASSSDHFQSSDVVRAPHKNSVGDRLAMLQVLEMPSP